MARQKSLRDLQVQDWLQAYFTARNERGESYEHIGASLKPRMSKAAIHHVAATGRSIGTKLLTAVANAEFAGSLDRLYAAAAAAWDSAGKIAPASAMTTNPELAKAVEFLRGSVPDKVLDGWLTAHSSNGWAGVTRDGFVTMIRASQLQTRASATEDLERARSAHIRSK